MTSFETEINLPVLVEGRYRAKQPDTRSWECPMGYPGDPEDFELEHVWLVDGKDKIDIIKYLSAEDCTILVEQGCEVGREDEEG